MKMSTPHDVPTHMLLERICRYFSPVFYVARGRGIVEGGTGAMHKYEVTKK